MTRVIQDEPGVFHLYIHTDSEAFQGKDVRDTLSQVLQSLAARLREGENFSKYRTLFDRDANDVGRAKLNRSLEE